MCIDSLWQKINVTSEKDKYYYFFLKFWGSITFFCCSLIFLKYQTCIKLLRETVCNFNCLKFANNGGIDQNALINLDKPKSIQCPRIEIDCNNIFAYVFEVKM
jgi:hypothetical protein